MKDTSKEFSKLYKELLLTKSNEERLKMGCSMYETAKQLVEVSIREQRPHISSTEMLKEIFLRFYASDFKPAEQKKVIQHIETSSRESGAK
ncbi:MAG: hypothetical protein U9O41_09615 [Candidatus Aerophobetes bacterium]|nr:hypothetical protein [Candidatus Aerophobetes bacterium]